ncbi:N-acetylglucosamine-6-phosphate deacetylase [Microbacterium caowuchunii]|uniref:Amidohydrolase family protein n=1 Tax=Microbacterium caowuchunii TaxID=2614638 RepID=A0A5N0TGG1_9MICO|nr:amidohydrolase family protein [Microbacterium caowuchunii]KAA9132369.1 amidohydrolase family protein [Microbacterium caowuchunii]
MNTLIHSVRVVSALPAGPAIDLADGWVHLAGGQVRAVGTGDAWRHARDDDTRVVDGTAEAGPGATLTPGLVDIHNHGGAGCSFDDGLDAVAAAAAAHRADGTTRLVASLVSAPVALLRDQLAAIALACRRLPGILGAHLEGPFLSPLHAGAHAPEALLRPTPELIDPLLETGVVRQMTIAPELDGAPAAIARIVAHGTVVAIGHTHSDAATARAAIDAGATLVTHAFNAMLPLHHRAPGVVGVALADPRVMLEAIPDGVHLHDDVLGLLLRAAPDRVVLVTDAMAAAACGDGAYRLGGKEVEVRDGVARLRGSDTIAGSTLTLAAGLRHATAAGIPLPQAVSAATLLPARAIRAGSVGAFAPGYVADAVLWDGSLNVREVWQDGPSGEGIHPRGRARDV